MTATQILKARAKILARPHIAEKPIAGILSVVEFRLARERYAVEHKFVREVLSLKDLTPMPCTPDFVVGLINVRGQILPVISIKGFLNLPESGITDLHRVLIVQRGDVELGLLADEINGMREIAPESIQPS